ncbi:SIS domain-containing protein [Nonomuraea spiralis]|uniref:SIS domain-containing protein n=1 Tax=Nonomuraea spiralis TaxID=46182 RepID=A0ABV5I9G1_9ACTN|nr:SIS domain-containing protein [Nonomuraea spiralis]GGT06992.1 hypothetical protein GCM10010176_059330 [Nonomuraea spiralis]
MRAHGRPGDVLVCLSAGGGSPNVPAAARAAQETGIAAWALTGPAPNPPAGQCDEAVAVPAEETATVQNVHLAMIHLLCDAIEEAL